MATNQNVDSLVQEIKTKNVYDEFSENKKMFAFSTYFAKSKYYGYSNILVVGKMNNGMGGVAIEKFVGLYINVYIYYNYIYK